MLQKRVIQEGSHLEFASNELLFLGSSGQPYRGSLYVAFDSLGEGFELLDFKRFITSLRSKTMSAEDVAFVIYTEIASSINAAQLGVVVELGARGGIMHRVSYGAAFEPHKRANIFQIG